MNNPFTSIPDSKYNLNTNKFDWTHTRNLSTKLGMITPIFVAKMPEHSSISIDPKHAFQFMPMVFPIQSRIQVRMSFYRMPIRAMWKDYQNWISSINTPQHANYVPPFVNFSNSWSDSFFSSVFGTGSLADYFGLPTTFDGFVSKQFMLSGKTLATGRPFMLSTAPEVGTVFEFPNGNIPLALPYNNSFIGIPFTINDDDTIGREVNISRVQLDVQFPGFVPDDVSFAYLVNYYEQDGYNVITKVTSITINTSEVEDDSLFLSLYPVSDSNNNKIINGEGIKQAVLFSMASLTPTEEINGNVWLNVSVNEAGVYASVNGGEISKSTCPWYNFATLSGLKLSSYPWRMYDAIYNTFIRYIRNNPFVSPFNGVTEYNKVTTLYERSGADFVFESSPSNPNEVIFRNRDQILEYASPRFANWEFDVFTTAVQSPQQGLAPLVGLTVREVTTTVGTDDVGNPISVSNLNQYLTDEDGNTYRVTLTENEQGEVTPSYEKVEMIEGRQISTLYNAVSEGISIEDFRMVNAYTKYLELNQRRGYRYKDIIEGRYDVKLSYNELLMPEFIGGFTRDVDINPVTQTVQTVPSGTSYDGALGSKAGDAFTFGSAKSNITCYNEEESFVMGLMSFVVEPIYTQTLPKFFLDRDVLDKWSPEFNNLGFQPISNAEVAPIQYFVNEPQNLNGTFGYQRPWYQYLSQVNTAHGDFRGPLRNFLMHRVFSGAPKLNKDFTIINPNHVNDVFNVTENTDKIFGQVKLYCSVKLGVNRDAIPKLD